MDPIKLELLFERQMKLMEMFVNQQTGPAPPSSNPNHTMLPSVDGIVNSISQFNYDPEANVTFDTWYQRYEDLFTVDLASQDDAWKVRVLLRKLGPAEYERYCNLILPQKPRDNCFDDTIKLLREHFGDHSSLFSIRYRCLKMTMNENDDFLTHVGTVNRECERFRLRSLTDDQFKALILICSLQSPRFTDIRTRLLNQLEQNPKLTLHDIADEYQRLINLQKDIHLVESTPPKSSDIRALRKSKNLPSATPDPPTSPNVPRKSIHTRPTSQNTAKKTPPSPCWHCGAWHFVKSCPYKNHRCSKCKIIGHKNGFCQPRQLRYHNPAKAQQNVGPKSPKRSLSLRAICQVTTPAMRKYIDLQMNGHDTRLQLDTASDITVISEKLWNYIGRPPITNTSQSLVSACGGQLKLIGELKCFVSFRTTKFTGICYVTKNDLNVLGLDWFDRLHLADVPLNSLRNTVKKHKMLDNSGRSRSRKPNNQTKRQASTTSPKVPDKPPGKHPTNHSSSQKGR
uniref:Peptidase A2 domain-containing protein n=1 Tax=Trichobilharzia regenti TaxID=157069 RepID=A0AA85KDY8_TRIRE|nr:unnamed protein product [Trichobilharzia regenti]